MRKTFRIFLLTLVVASSLGALTGCSSKAEAQTISTEEAGEKTSEETGASLSIDVFGKIEATDKEEIYINFPAFVEEILVEEGQLVTKGQQLIQLDYEDYKNEILKTEKEKLLNNVKIEDGLQETAALGSQLSSLQKEKSVKSSYLKSDNYNLQAFESQLTVLEGKLALAREKYENGKALLEIGSTSEKEVEELRLAVENLEDEIIGVEKSMKSFKEKTKVEIDNLNASIAAKQDQKTQLEDNNQRAESKKVLSEAISDLAVKNMNSKLARSYIKDNSIVLDMNQGIIDDIACEKSSYVGGSEPTYCLSILDAESIQVIADVPEEFIKDIQVGQNCTITPYYDNTESFSGCVERIDDRAVKEDGEVIVKVYVDITGEAKFLKPGLSVDVNFEKE